MKEPQKKLSRPYFQKHQSTFIIFYIKSKQLTSFKEKKKFECNEFFKGEVQAVLNAETESLNIKKMLSKDLKIWYQC